MFKTLLLLFCALIAAQALASEPQRVRYMQSNTRYAYEVELLEHALKLTEQEYGPAKTELVETPAGRSYLGLLKGQFDVGFYTTSHAKESRMLAVKVPLLQGMLGYRLLLTTPKSETRVNQARTLEDFQTRLVGGIGLYWEDNKIAIHNKILNKAAVKYPKMLQMLNDGEIDYFARGASEIFRELDQHSKSIENLKVSEQVAFFYPLAFYYFVNPSNHELAERIKKGLKMAESDGSFRRIFNSHFADEIKRLKAIRPKNILVLENPYMKLEQPLKYDWWMESDLLPASSSPE